MSARAPYNDESPRRRAARIDLRGMRFGRLVALEDVGTGDDRQGDHKWRCICDCGRETTPYGVHLRKGRTKSCGCLSRELAAARGAVRGPFGRRTEFGSHPLRGIWKKMLRRCENTRDDRFADYGGRGIRVCERWHDFALFCEDIGPRPSTDHSLDRYPNNDGNYEPGNVRWATRVEQQRNMRSNRRLTWNGETLTLVEWAERYGLSFSVLSSRLSRGWSLGDAIKPRKFIREKKQRAA